MARTQGSHSDITGPRIRQVAERLFAQHGFAAVSMRQIAAEVGVQAGALYNYTSDKQSLLAELMRAHMEELLAAYDEPVASPMARLQHFVSFHIAQNFERADSVFIAYMELRSLNAENFSEIEQLRRLYEARLEAILSDGHGSGDFSVPDVRVAARALIAMLNGVNIWYRDSGRLSLTEVQQQYWEMIRKSVAA